MTTKITTDNIASETLTTILGPKVSSIVYPGDDTAANTAGGDSITLLGSGFNNGASVVVNGTSSGVVTVVSSTQITFTAPAQTAGTYVIYVINSDGGTAISIPGISYSGTPTWSTTAGNIGVGYETGSISTTVTASGDAPITYSVVSGTLPTGSSLNTSSGLISGTASATASSTTYSFTIKATDAQNQDTNRAFSITVNPDVVTWSTPTSNETYSVSKDIAIANVAMSATSASGGSITYTADTLPTGLSITGANIAGTPTVAASTSTTLTATSTSTRSATRTINWVVSIANDTYFKNVTLLLNGETTVTPFISDASTNSFGLTIVGDTKPVLFNPYTPGYNSNYFDGTGDYLSIPSNAVFQFGTGDFTIECWFYDTGTSDTYPGIISSANGWQSGSTALRFNNTGNRKFGFFHNPTGDPIFSSTNTFSSYQWYHVAVTRSGTSMKMFVNGVQEASATVSTSISLDHNTGVFIGSGFDSSSKIKGYISNVRVVKGTAVYTSAFTPSATPLTAIANTSLLTCQSNRLIDNSTNTFTITKNGDTTVSSAIPFTQNSSYSTYGSTYFDGTGDYLTIPSNSAFAFGTGDFTIECWIYLSGSNVNYRTIVSTRSSSGTTTGWCLATDSTGDIYIYSGAYIVEATSAIVPNTWYHVAVCRLSGTTTLYLDGVSRATSVTARTYSDTGLSISLDPYINVDYWQGYITNLRLVKGTAIYTSAFTPSTSPLTAVANTSLLTLQYNGNVNNSNFIDNSNFNNTITRSGNATQGSFSPYSVTGWSLYTNGTSSYAYVPYSSTRSIGTGDFSIECWVYIAKQPQNYTRIWSHQSNYGLAGSIGVELGLGTVDTLIQTLVDGNSQVYTGATYDTSGTNGSGHVRQWIHVVSSRQNGYLRLFVNGVLREANASSTNINGTSTTSFGTNSQLGGDLTELYISNFRMCIGSVPASYSTTNTTNGTTIFTPPTSPVTVTSQGASNVTLLLFQSNRFVDNSPYNFAITTVSNPSIQAFGPFGSIPEAVPISYSNYFDGTGDYLTVPSSANFTLPADFTIECWIYVPSISRTIQRIFSSNAGPSGACYFSVGNDIGTGAGAGKLCANGHLVSPYSAGFITASTAIPINTWIHAALVRSGSTITIYQDGVSVASATDSATWDFNNSAGVRISGAIWAGSSEDFGGYISNVRVVKGTAVYTSTFTPSTTPLTAIANTSLLTCQSTTMIDNSTNAFAITAVGNTVPRIFNPFGYTAQSYTSYTPSTHGGSAYFDGTGDYLALSANNSFATGTRDFTIEGWIYVTDLSAIRCICGTRTTADTTTGWNLGILTTGSMQIYDNTGYAATGAGSVVVNTWCHFAFVRQSNVFYSYINGIQKASTACSRDWTQNTFWVGINGGSGEPFLGYISNLRFVNATVVYTSNFVPPTTSVASTNNTVLLLNFTHGGIIDQHGTNVLETVGNAQLSTAVKKYNVASMYFNGSSTCTIPGSPNLNFGTGDFTIEMWVYSASQSSGGNRTMGNGAGAGWGANKWIFTTTTPGNVNKFTWHFWNYNSGGSDILVSSSASNNSTWTYVAVTRSGNTFRMFVNGVIEATGTSSASVDGNIPAQLTLGNSGVAGDTSWTGYLDDLRITKGFARYTANFTAPTSAFTTK